jgi:hypothetical protein
MNREEWLVEDITQVTLVINLMTWVTKTEKAFVDMSRGTASAIKDYAVS